MANQHFDLTSEPWVKVMTLAGKVEIVSLTTLFNNAQHYRRLAGEMRTQDFAIMRLLLAILQTVYSRYDAQGEPYDWLTIDEQTMQPTAVDQEEFNGRQLIKTWGALYKNKAFTASVNAYLKRYQTRFDFFGDQPFAQVTAAQFDQLVPADHRIAKGKGTVDVKQINRRISESNNSRAIFAPKTEGFKSDITVPELIRWVITYHAFTGVTDKTKVKADKFSVAMGWPYRLNPVFVQGDTLFDTLMLNLVLVQPDDPQTYHVERPQWEFPDQLTYVQAVIKATLPDNVAQLYTLWSRILYIQWQDEGEPKIFSGGLPSPSVDNAFVEPMTVWKWAAQEKPPVFKPARRSVASLNHAMWRNFGQYIAADDGPQATTTHVPGVVSWLGTLKAARQLPRTFRVHLATVTLISDGNATSQAPVAEAFDDMALDADVLFDEVGAERWPVRIEDTIELTQKVGRDFYGFTSAVAKIRGVGDSSYANRQSADFYDRLNVPFKAWLASLSGQDDRDEKIENWKATLRQIALRAANEIVDLANNRDLRGITDDNGYTNIVIALQHFQASLKKDLNQSGEGKK